MKHSGVLSFLTFGFGYLSGISLVFEPALYLKFAGATVISYLSFILALQWEGEE